MQQLHLSNILAVTVVAMLAVEAAAFVTNHPPSPSSICIDSDASVTRPLERLLGEPMVSVLLQQDLDETIATTWRHCAEPTLFKACECC